MDSRQLENEQKLIDEYINRMGADRTNADIAPITDGVVNPVSYLASRLRIAWVLKEPYDDFDDDGKPYGGGWSMRAVYYKSENVYDNIKVNKTLNTISYVTYGIQNDIDWEKIPWIHEDVAVADSLRSIVHMNISKFPGGTSTSWQKLYSAYEYWRPILLFQLKIYKPQVVIFGNVMHHFAEDLGLVDIMKTDEYNHADYAVKDGSIFINAYHPCQRSIPKEEYVEGLVRLVREHRQELV